jgi:hypothetical protein
VENQGKKDSVRTELKWIFSIIAMLAVVAVPYFAIKQDIALVKQELSGINAVTKSVEYIKGDIALIQKDIAVINSNHLGTTQRLTEQMANMQINLLENQKAVIELQKQTLVILQRIQ